VPLWVKNVDNFRFENVKVNGIEQPAIPPLTPESEQKLPIRD
jgi:hypothetical protein